MWVQERGGCFHLAWDTSHLELDFQVRAVRCLDLWLVTDAPAGTYLGAGDARSAASLCSSVVVECPENPLFTSPLPSLGPSRPPSAPTE